MEPHRPKGQASLFDLGCTKQKRTEDVPARELIIRLRPDVQQAVAARDAAIAASIASRPAPVKRPGGEAQGACTIGGASPSRREAYIEQKIPKFAKFANFLNFSGASQKLNARKLIILIIQTPRKR